MEPILAALLVLFLIILFVLITVLMWLSMLFSKPIPQNTDQIANQSGKINVIQSQVDGNLQAVSGQIAGLTGKPYAMDAPHDMIDVLHKTFMLWKRGQRDHMVKTLSDHGFGRGEAFYHVAQANLVTLSL
jgi:hypothetical protein